MARVYLSYATPDRAIADEVASWLREAGHEAFLDHDPRHGIGAGEDWKQRLYHELREVDVVIGVVTSSFVASPWCSAELGIADARGCRLMPLRAEAGVVHPLMQELQYVDYHADPRQARDRVLQTVRLLDDGGGAWREGDNPFPGLEPFTPALSRVFFGRAAEAREVGNRLRAMGSTGGMLAIVGPSGCGKSSLLNAAVVPLLDTDPAWLTVPRLFPGSDPLPELARALATTATRSGMDWSPSDVRGRLEADTNGLRRVAEDLLLAGGPGMHQRRLLVTVDQAEELFTRTAPDARQRFAQLLRDAVAGPVQVVAAMRSEFLDGLRDLPALAGMPIEAYVLAPLDRQMLRDVIEQPAKVARLNLEDGLVPRLVADTGSGEALPLLAFHLRQMADGLPAGGTLSLARYQDLGGVHGALSRHADAALADAARAGGLAQREVLAGLTRLVTIDETGRRARRRVKLTDLFESLRVALQVFVERRLLLSDIDDDGQVWLTVAHEALLTGWRPLDTATADITSALRNAQTVEQAATDWNSAGRPDHYLWDPERLPATLVTLGMTGDPAAPPIVELNDEALAFLEATGRRRRRRPWRRDRPLKDQTFRTPPPTAQSDVADPPDEAVADLPDEVVTDPLLSAAVAGIDQHSGVLSDLESAEDRLGVTDDVRSIARMLAALNTTPPLSIALLGNWGCGKSSFMRQVIERVDALAAASKPNPRGSAYATNVRQVRFNAWHYSDDHLWCGLVEHLFLELGDRGRDPNEDQRDSVQAELATAQARLHRLTEDLRAVDAVSVDAGWLGRLYHPFRLARVLRAVGKSLRDEIRAPKRLLIGLGLILLGAGLVVGFALFGQSVIGWIAGAIAVVSGLLSPLVLAWRHIETFTKEARTKLQDEKKKSEDSIRSLETQLDLIDPARRLENLLSAISSTDRYERYRGLTGRIRHDLDQLSRDLAAAQQRWATEGIDLPPPLQRIILYVDDLDRCTSSRVVEVLQAVNLLLSMPLFVVVVAVDPRWLLLALEEHHGRLLSGGHHARLAERRIRSLNYLDKIFHIPYAVRPMSHQGADYLRSLLPPADESGHHSRIEKTDRENSTPARARFIASDLDRDQGQGETPTHHQGVVEDEGVAANQEAAADQVAAGQVATDDFAPNQDAAADQATVDQATASQETAADQVAAVHETVADRDIAGNEVSANVQPEAIDVTGRELRLQENERDFLPLLASLLPTPRAVKKLTNLYRLLRIGVPKDQLAKFIGGDDGGPYQAVALLLAAVVGAPAQAESFLLALSSATANPGRDIVDVLADFGEPPVANLLAERIRLIRKTLPVHGNVETYQESVQTVARYSFETYHRFSGD